MSTDTALDRENDTWITSAEITQPRPPEPAAGTWVDTANRDLWKHDGHGAWTRFDERAHSWVAEPAGWDLVHWSGPLRSATPEDFARAYRHPSAWGSV